MIRKAFRRLVARIFLYAEDCSVTACECANCTYVEPAQDGQPANMPRVLVCTEHDSRAVN